MTTAVRRLPRARRGFTLVELMMAFFVFGMIVLLFGAVFPVVTKGSHVGANYGQASFLAQHKIDQIRNVGASKTDGPSLLSAGLVDSSTANADGSFSFTNTDNLVDNTKTGTNAGFYPGFFPAGSTGTVLVQDYNAVNGTVTAGTLKYVTITISWAGGSQHSGSFTAHTILSGS